MRHPIVGFVALATLLAGLTACTSGDDASTREAAPGEVTGGEVIVPGDLSAADVAAADESGAAVTTAEPPAPATSTTSTTPTTSASPAAPTTPTTPTDEPEVIGDGPVLTTPPGGSGSVATPGAGDGLVPAFFAFEATTIVACDAADPGTVRLRWEVIGAETVDVAIGSTTRIFRLAQLPAASLDVPLNCASGSDYFVIATNPEGTVTRSIAVSGA